MKKLLLSLILVLCLILPVYGDETVVHFGISGDIPIIGDWDGDGTEGLGLYRPSVGKFFLRNSMTAGTADKEIKCGPPESYPFIWYSGTKAMVGVYDTDNGKFYFCTEDTPVPPPPDPPPPPPPPPVTDCRGFQWVWGSYPMFYVDGGGEYTYCITVDKDYMYFMVGLSGLTMNTYALVQWYAPDGTPYPQNSTQGSVDIMSMNGAGLLVLRSQEYPYSGKNIPYQWVPRGVWTMKIKGINLSYIKAFIDAY